MISCVWLGVSFLNIPNSTQQANLLVAPVARVLCLQLVHLLYSQLELLVLALLV
jgi:hypothetical protein